MDARMNDDHRHDGQIQRQRIAKQVGLPTFEWENLDEFRLSRGVESENLQTFDHKLILWNG